MFIVLLGPPGAGKGTQADRMVTRLGIPHISTGNLLRGAADRRTPIGLQAAAYLERGELVPDSVMTRLIDERLSAPDAHRGAIFDGYPRTVSQAAALDAELGRRGTHVGVAIALDIGSEVIVQRLGSRRVCARCGSTFNAITNPPRERDICDRCGEPLVCRADDSPKVIRRRLEIYRAEAGPIQDYYCGQNRLAVIAADHPTGMVGDAIMVAVKRASTYHPVQPLTYAATAGAARM